MNWGSASEFFAMGGHGLFVWGSYGAALAALLAEPWLVARRHRRALAEAAEASADDATLEGPAPGPAPGARQEES
ncbi:MAG: heme exporter protein CcmD [Rubrivivax sp.]|nr:heme exporter protein CcmD [Rubrivivax sp.]